MEEYDLEVLTGRVNPAQLFLFCSFGDLEIAACLFSLLQGMRI